MSASRLMVLSLLTLMLDACDGDGAGRPRLRVTVATSACKPSCAAPQYEFLVLRSVDGGGECTIVARTANVGGGSVVLEGADVSTGERVTIVVRVVCPTVPGGCPFDCFAAQQVTASEGSVPLALAQSSYPLCVTGPTPELPPACLK